MTRPWQQEALNFYNAMPSMGLVEPRTRRTDPDTSHAAAHAVTPGLNAMEEAILEVAPRSFGVTAFTIALVVGNKHPHRWDEGSIRTRVSNMGKRGLLVKCGEGKSPRGRRADLWRLP